MGPGGATKSNKLLMPVSLTKRGSYPAHCEHASEKHSSILFLSNPVACAEYISDVDFFDLPFTLAGSVLPIIVNYSSLL